MYIRNPAIVFIIIFIGLLHSTNNPMNNIGSDANKYSIDLNFILKVRY